MSATRVLFVDDDENFLASVRRMLHSNANGWDTQFAQDAREAMDIALSEGGIDTIVTDVRMPETDGFELLAQLKEREETRNIPVVVLTGFDEVDAKRRALELGATDLLNKPISREDLVARLRNVLQLKTQQDLLKSHNEQLEQRVSERTVELEASRLDIVWRLAKAGEYRDEDTGNHIARVASYSQILGKTLGLEREHLKLLVMTSPLHDIGKIGVPDCILLKKGKLSLEERSVMQTHCQIGAGILLEEPKGMKGLRKILKRPEQMSPLVNMASNIALSHHERWDGCGYPQRLKGKQIPMEGRIVAVADVYDALRSARPYKRSSGEDAAWKEIVHGSKSQFDPAVVAAFDESHDQFCATAEAFNGAEREEE